MTLNGARQIRLGLWIAVGLSLLAIIVSCLIGSAGWSLAETVNAVTGMREGRSVSVATTLFELRLARALCAYAAGASLALAGALMQALLRNPLADPYVLGVSGGAAVGALLAMLVSAAAWMVGAAAFGGAMAVSALLVLLAYRPLQRGHSAGGAPLVLLTGVAIASGCGALITLILSIAPDGLLRGMVFWLIGDLSGARLAWTPWLALLAALVFCVMRASSINVLALHGDMAITLGVNAAGLRRQLFCCAALLTACTVATAGSIGFVGLIVPHACRFIVGNDHRMLLPVSALAGGLFLVIADTLARTVAAPIQLPVGVVTALIGVPAFLWQLRRAYRR